jgi:hypothetical protein
MTQESPFELLLTLSRMQHRIPRRTVSLHPAPQCCAPSQGYPAGDDHHQLGWCPAVSRLPFAGHRSLMRGMGSRASPALLPPVTSTSPARRPPILGVAPGLGFFGPPPPQQPPVGTSSMTEGYRGVTPFPLSIARTLRVTLSTGFGDAADGAVRGLPMSSPVPFGSSVAASCAGSRSRWLNTSSLALPRGPCETGFPDGGFPIPPFTPASAC